MDHFAHSVGRQHEREMFLGRSIMMRIAARRLAIATVAAAPFITGTPADAVPLFDCSKPVYQAVCSEHELRDLGVGIDAELARLLRSADPLTAMLLKRDQIWFEQILAAEDLHAFQGRQDADYLRVLATLKARRDALARLRTGGATTPVGSWSNAFATATIGKTVGNALAITLQARLSYRDVQLGEGACMATTTAALGKDGWYSATISDQKDSEGQIDVIRFKLQGNTLRIVHEGNSGICTWASSPGDEPSKGADVLTGSFFPAGDAASAPGSVAARTVAPSFDCARAENADEQEICADPELALADVEIAQFYRKTIRRLDHRLAAHLRTDQRAWASDNAVDYQYNLHPGGDKAQYDVHHTSSARNELAVRQKERIILLTNLDEKRRGVEGLWIGHNAVLAIAPAKGKSDGTMHAAGAKWVADDYRARCDFESDGRIENSVFKPTKDFPTLTRDGGTLVVATEDPDKREDFFDKNGQEKKPWPDYCNRMRSPKARLLPVKLGIGIDAHKWAECYSWHLCTNHR
jgi:uncharacterized protein